MCTRASGEVKRHATLSTGHLTARSPGRKPLFFQAFPEGYSKGTPKVHRCHKSSNHAGAKGTGPSTAGGRPISGGVGRQEGQTTRPRAGCRRGPAGPVEPASRSQGGRSGVVAGVLTARSGQAREHFNHVLGPRG